MTTAPTSIPARPHGRDRGTTILLLLAAAVAFAGISFAVGRLTASSGGAGNGSGSGAFAGGSFRPNGSFAPGGFAGAGVGGGSIAIQGTVTAIDGSTMTIQTSGGETVTVALGGSTTYHGQAPATASDVQAGTTVRVQVQTGVPGATPNATATPNGSAAGPNGRTYTATDVTVVPSN